MDKYDLFRVLTKSSYEEVAHDIRLLNVTKSAPAYTEYIAIFEAHGWNKDEYRDEHHSRYLHGIAHGQI